MGDIIYDLALFIFLIVLLGLIFFSERKYTKNTPYKPFKKRKIFHRILLGLIAGFHYSHFIGTYDHKRYNTQVFTPETLECYLGVFFALVFIMVYVLIAWYLKILIGISGLLIFLIPIITNIISIIKK